MRKTIFALALALLMVVGANAQKNKKPNIVVIWGDDVGWFNVSAYNMGMMGYKTPNIDRIGTEGIIFTDCYGENSCTAGRASFITGQSPFRTGLLKVGLPGAKEGLSEKDPTLAGLLKEHGYTTGQFGKNHLGDLDEHLPTNHGFDEFFGNLYHLNAEEEPENEDYPKGADFKAKFGPRGVIRSSADGPIKDTGPLTKKRMETVDEEFLAGSLDFMEQANKDEKPFFLWFNSSRMHIWTHLKEESKGVTGQGVYADGMAEHDGHVGQILDKLEELGITENTIVIYSTDNGAETFTWPDGGTIPFYGEKNTTWEGGFRVPAVMRWPEKIKSGQINNELISHQDWLPTLMAAVGDENVKEDLLKGKEVIGRDVKVHLDGYNFLPHLLGEEEKGPRNEFFYFTDDGSISALRYNDWKIMFTVQNAHGADVWSEPYTPLRLPMVTNLKRDPFERAHYEAPEFHKWGVNRLFVLVPAQSVVKNFLVTFKDYPPRQKPGSFSLDRVLEELQKSGTN